MRRATELLVQPPRHATVPDFIERRAEQLDRQHADRDPGGVPRRAARRRSEVAEAIGLARVPRSSEPTRRVGVLDRTGYTIEKLVLDAVPGLPVPALLYKPKGVSTPCPAVVHSPGHWMENGKLEPNLQRINLELVDSGIAVLCYDTLGQGERRVGWHQHGQLGTLLVGFTTLGVMLAEAIEAVELLASRDEFDAGRLGHIGASGGGHVGAHLAALDERVQATVIASYANSHHSTISSFYGTGWESFVCICCQVPELIAICSFEELMALAAPRAILQVNATDDPFFPIEGSKAVADRAEELFAAAGSPSAFSYREVAGGHGFAPEARAITRDWIIEQLRPAPTGGDADQEILEPPYAVTYTDVSATRDAQQQFHRRPDRLEGECLPQAVDSNAPLVEIARARAVDLRSSRPALTRSMLQRAFSPTPVAAPIRALTTNRILVDGCYVERLHLDSEDGVTLDELLLLPDEWTDDAPPVVVLLDEGGKAEALESEQAAVARAAGAAILAPDLRGTGESACGEWEAATTAFMLDRDLLNQRVWDARCVVESLWQRASAGQQIDRGGIVVWGLGVFGLIALIVAALDPRVAGAGGNHGFESLEELIEAEPTSSPMVYRYRLLELLDIDHLEALVAPRPTGRSSVTEVLANLPTKGQSE